MPSASLARAEPVTPLRPADNPFASRRIEALGYRFRHGDLDGLLGALAANGGRGAIIGRHGSGKTTLLDLLASRLSGELVRVDLHTDTDDPSSRALAALPEPTGPVHAVLVDGAEQLGPFAWRRVEWRCRRAGTLVITGHRSGRLPTLYRCTTDTGLLAELVRELSPETDEAVDLDALFHRHHGDIRLCFRELYDVCSQQ